MNQISKFDQRLWVIPMVEEQGNLKLNYERYLKKLIKKKYEFLIKSQYLKAFKAIKKHLNIE